MPEDCHALLWNFIYVPRISTPLERAELKQCFQTGKFGKPVDTGIKQTIEKLHDSHTRHCND